MKKLKNIAIMLLFALMANFIPMTVANAAMSKFGINYEGIIENSDGSRRVFVNFNSEMIENVKSVKLFTKVSKFDNPQSIVDGTTFTLATRESNNFITNLNEGDIKSFGNYEVDKIEVILKDGVKKVSFNSKYYTSLGENDKENGELVYYNTLSYEYEPLRIENCVFEKNTVKLGEAQNVNFEVKSSRQSVEPSKIYVTFKNIDGENGRTQVVEAKKKEGTGYTASLTLTNSLDTGYWNISDIEFIDNYGRTYDTSAYAGTYKVVSENTDIDAPILEDISLNSDKYDFLENNDVLFTLKVSDDVSGVNRVYIELYNEENSITKSFYADPVSSEENIFKAKIDGFEKNGIYEVKYIDLRDNAGNNVRYISSKYSDFPWSDQIIKDFSDFDIEVVNCVEPEQANIELFDVKNNSKNITNGTELDYSIKIKSNKRVDGVNIYLEGPNGEDRYIYGYVDQYDENGNIIEDVDGIYELRFNIEREAYKYFASGEYITKKVSVSYYSNENTIDYIDFYDERSEWIPEEAQSYDFSQLDFTCDNPNEDVKTPELLDISLDKGVVTPGETVEVTVKAKDDKSGFISEGWTRFPSVYYNFNYNSVSVFFYEYNEEENTFKGTIEIPSYISTGVYTVSGVYLYDMADNSKDYYWSNDESKSLLSKGTILVKKDVNEKLPPVISTDIEEGKTYKAPFTPIVSSDHGTIKMLLNDKEYNGEPINKLGDYHLYITATGVDGSISTQKVSFKVITEINDETKPEEIIDQIIESEEKVVSIEVKNESLEVDKSIFEAIKGLDKTVSFTQEDGTVWSFNGADIKDENLEGIGNIKISVKNVAEEENQEPINNIDAKAKVIHFDYHGVLPGKASVKVKVDNPQDVMGKDLTFYYFNPETQKPEKIQGPLSVDNDGFVTVEIEHCSDYFLSEYDNLADTPEPINLTVNKSEVNLVEGSSEKLVVTVTPVGTEVQYSSSNEGVAKVYSTGVIEAVAKGEAVINVKAGDVTKTVKVVVKAKEVDEEKPTEPENPVEEPGTETPVEEPQTPEEPSQEVPSETDNSSNEDKANLPQTGGMVSMNNALIISIAIIALGVVLLKKRKIYNK
ncbi:Ig-like domain-containing protein [Clostridium sp. UBA1652]|uniref:Ig-like domain-containing protein n=1 Tax=Clostridium sp. UBA1652 TaxID=1946348 RepID=UPI00257FADBA|nr:Ig-like domain-containing protein [Clostridium sp. UBA1652]